MKSPGLKSTPVVSTVTNPSVDVAREHRVGNVRRDRDEQITERTRDRVVPWPIVAAVPKLSLEADDRFETGLRHRF